MKKIFSIALMGLALASHVYAQNLQASQEMTSKDMNVVSTYLSKGLYMDQGYLYLVTNAPAGIVLDSRFFKEAEVQRYDSQGKLLDVAPVEGSKKHAVVASSKVGNTIYMLIHDGPHKTENHFYTAAVDVNTMQQVGTPTPVIDDSYGKADDIVISHSQSPNGRYTALLTVVIEKKNGVRPAKVVMLDEKMNKLWEKTYSIRGLSDIKATDQGMAVLVGHSATSDTKSSVVAYYFDKEDEAMFSQDVKVGPIGAMRILGVVNDYAVVGGYTEGDRPSCFGLSIDLASGDMSSPDIHYLDENDASVLDQKKPNAIGYNISGAETSFGGALALQRMMVTIIRSQSGSTTNYNLHGTLLFGVDTTGRILWHRNVRTDMFESEGTLWMNYRLEGMGDKVLFVQSEHAKTPDTYVDEPVRTLKLVNGIPETKLAAYVIDTKGSVNKQILGREMDGLLIKAYNVGDKRMVITTKRKDSVLLSVK